MYALSRLRGFNTKIHHLSQALAAVLVAHLISCPTLHPRSLVGCFPAHLIGLVLLGVGAPFLSLSVDVLQTAWRVLLTAYNSVAAACVDCFPLLGLGLASVPPDYSGRAVVRRLHGVGVCSPLYIGCKLLPLLLSCCRLAVAVPAAAVRLDGFRLGCPS